MGRSLGQISIVEEVPELEQYQSVPISFEVRSKFEVYSNTAGESFSLVEIEVAPYTKDYDALEKPSEWPGRFDICNWVFLAALEGEKRIGGAAVAWKTPGLEMLEGRADLACLWDIRVLREKRGRGIGKLLFEAAAKWAKAHGCRELKIETQNTNVPACRFYASQGCILRRANRDAYPAEMNEIQLIWHLDL